MKTIEDNQDKQNYHFTVGHIIKICSNYNVNANWIFGIEDNVFFNLKIEINKGIKQDVMPTTNNKENIKKKLTYQNKNVIDCFEVGI